MQMKKDEFKYIGKRVIREDSADKVRGRYDYLADSLPTRWSASRFSARGPTRS